MEDLSKFTHQYSLSKTLRFALKPVRKTEEHIKTAGLLGKDADRAEQYKKAKKIIDLYHKDFIEKALKTVHFSLDELQAFSRAYYAVQKNKKDDKSKGKKKEFAKQQEVLRKIIVKGIKDSSEFKRLFKKELIQNDLPAWLTQHPDAKANSLDTVDPKEYPKIIEEFKKWTTYFIGFNENRNNMYADEPKATAISYRIVHENLPKFLDNLDKWKRLQKDFPDINDFSGIDDNSKTEISKLEKSMNVSLSKVFALEYFNQCLNQSGIDTFNTIRGGKSNKDGSKLQGVNEIINLYRQQKEHALADADDEQRETLRKEIKTLRGCQMEELYKQILSDRKSHSFLPEKFENDKELITAIHEFYNEIKTNTFFDLDGKKKSVLSGLQSCLKRLNKGDCDLKKVYVSNASLTAVSHECYKDWGVIRGALATYADAAEKNFSTKAKREQWMKTKYFSIADLQPAIDTYVKTIDTDAKSSDVNGKHSQKKNKTRSIIQYFNDGIREENEKDTPVEIHVFNTVKDTYDNAKDVLEAEYDRTPDTLHQEKDKVEKIKAFLDRIQELLHFVKPLYIDVNVCIHIREDGSLHFVKPPRDSKGKKDKEASADAFDKDAAFYHDFDECYERLRLIVPLYNKVRNYLTRKKFKIEKYKLNFEDSTLLAGLDVNKEAQYKGIFFLKDDRYYLGIMDKQHNRLFQDIPNEAQEKGYSKVNYKLLPGANKMLPKVFFARGNINYYNPSDEILRIRNHATHTKNGDPQKGYEKHDFNLDDCHTIIDFFKKSINKHPDWKHFDFKFSSTKQYNDTSDFYRQVEAQGYKITYSDISEAYINACIDEGKLYLFEIYSKDFSDKKKNTGTPNLHTLYWKAIFDETNLQDVVYKLSGGAEVFFRKASIEYTDTEREKGHHSEALKGTFKYPIIKDKRYSKDTYLFHVPITINFKEASSDTKFNDTVNAYLKKNKDTHILSIDRGERHLAYYTILDPKNGEIKKQGSFNTTTYHVKGEERCVDYHQKLHDRERARDEARKSWNTIETIKELKEGYLSQIVHSIATMMIKYNAIVVFEDLNFGFKRGRFRFEKQVYQKLEKMLIDKLNYLVFKNKTAGEIGGTLCGYQLTAPFVSFQKLGKQTGFIFYVPAYHTSKICPATGFVNLLYPKYQNLKRAQEFFGAFDAIRFNEKENFFEFHLHYSKFVENKFIKKADGMKDQWTICTNGTRLKIDKKKNIWKTEEIDLVAGITSLLNEHNITYDHGQDIHKDIATQNDTDFFKSLFYYLRLTLQLRNSRMSTEDVTDNKKDYILSCVKDEHGHFFDSSNYDSNGSMPKNSDANGAYHIGLKGLWALQQIHQWDGSTKSPNLAISNEKWYDFVQNKRYKKA